MLSGSDSEWDLWKNRSTRIWSLNTGSQGTWNAEVQIAIHSHCCTQEHPISRVTHGHPCPWVPGVRSTDGQEPATPQPLHRRVQEGPHSPEPCWQTGFEPQPKLWAWTWGELGEGCSRGTREKPFGGTHHGGEQWEADNTFCACGPGQALGWRPVAWAPLYTKGNTSPSTTPGPPQGEGSSMGSPSHPTQASSLRAAGPKRRAALQPKLWPSEISRNPPQTKMFLTWDIYINVLRAICLLVQHKMLRETIRSDCVSFPIRSEEVRLQTRLLCSAGGYTRHPPKCLLEISGWRCWTIKKASFPQNLKSWS